METQQSSDVTYRVYDYDRPGDDGKLRPLHLEQSLDVIDYAMEAPKSGEVTAPEVDGVTVLVSNDCYTVERLRVDGELKFATPFPFTCVSVIEGEGSINGEPVVKGSHLLALSACDELVLTGDMTIITSHLPERAPGFPRSFLSSIECGLRHDPARYASGGGPQLRVLAVPQRLVVLYSPVYQRGAGGGRLRGSPWERMRSPVNRGVPRVHRRYAASSPFPHRFDPQPDPGNAGVGIEQPCSE